MSRDMNASNFVGTATFKIHQLECILRSCVKIYNKIIEAKLRMGNEENTITDTFVKYLKDDEYRAKDDTLKNFLFEREVGERRGFLDIKVIDLDTFKHTSAYYSIECKKLDGTNYLNAEYVRNGICRYVSGYYSSYYNANAMFGYLVKSVSVQKDIVDEINIRLTRDYINAQGKKVNANVTRPLEYEDFADGYPYSFVSEHDRNSADDQSADGKLTMYHLIFDLSENII